MNSLIARGLHKRYRRRVVVDSVDLSVAGGEVVGLLGPNGAGKTTTFYMMVGLIRPDRGTIELNDRNLTHLPIHERARLGVGYLPQEASIFRKLTVEENLRAILEMRTELSASERNSRLLTLLEELHISHLANHLGLSLSGGERRRVEIARALVVHPQFMLLDEPFAGVDPLSLLDIQRIIQHLSSRGIGILITDHNVRETLGICQRAYILHSGQIIAEGPSREILANPEVRRVYLGEHFQL
ncbi:ABC transporter, ATP-binding protein [mine drainage metagenome]|uniref:Lipopolysaccharide export system ATP-binding protein LptB n=3 Tax=mine drainage metagenome TaxID=410659 RepID=T1C3U3_9ZZZZ